MKNRIGTSAAPASRRLAALAVLGLSVLAIQTSCTPQPNCPDRTHVQHAPSYSGHVWECVPDGGAQ